MKKTMLLLSLGLLFSTPALAEASCFLAKENHHVIVSEGECRTRHAPHSTFDIAISLMGYSEGVLMDQTHPEWPFNLGYVEWVDSWKQPHNPLLWMKDNCLWYSQVVTQKLGTTKFKDYVTKFNYGNHDVSGDKGQNNGLTHAWLASSLKISPEEQTIFLQTLLNNKLPVNSNAHDMTKNIMFMEDFVDGWKLYGKTGSGPVVGRDGSLTFDRQVGWFVGWLQKDNRTIVFAHYHDDEVKQAIYGNTCAKASAKEKLMQIIQNDKK